MIVEVLYFAELKSITGKEQEKFELSEPNLDKLFKILIKTYGYKIRNVIWNESKKEIPDIISVLINNKAIHEKNPVSINLNDGDKIVFLMPVSGG
jgi:MoaD family protein